MHTAAAISSPLEARPPSLRAISGGNCAVSASRSDSPWAGYSPALVAPAVANSAVPPEEITLSTVSVPNTPSAMAM